MTRNIRIALAAFAVATIAACSTSTPVKPVHVGGGKTYVPAGK